jgi:hypothetical protein
MMTSFNCVVTGTLLHLDFYDFLRESVLVEIIVRMFPPEREGNSYLVATLYGFLPERVLVEVIAQHLSPERERVLC